MAASSRVVVPELLDELAPQDPRAERSRRDLRIIHKFMRSASILRRLIANLELSTPPRRIIELGAGDGTLLLAVARSLVPRWAGIELTLLDRVDLLADRTREAYARPRVGRFVPCARMSWIGSEATTAPRMICASPRSSCIISRVRTSSF